MKKLLAIALMLALVLSVNSCSSKKDDPDKQTTANEVKSNDKEEEIKKENTSDIGQKKEKVDVAKEQSLDDMEKYLLEKGLLKGEKTETMAELIGAKSGFKYLDSNVEIYEYDTNSEEYKKLSKGGGIEIEDYGVTIKSASINEKFVLIFSNESTNQDIVKAFNEFR